jgi:HK97 gp10 family phage protein
MAGRGEGDQRVSYKSSLPKITAELAVRLDAATREAADLIAARAKDRVPVLTGRLRDAIHVEAAGVGEHAVVAGSREIFYGNIVEHGGAHTPPRPFLIPAFEESRDEALKLGAAALRGL